MSKKILITGTSGLIGYNLAERLVKEGYEVYGTIHKNKKEVDGVKTDIKFATNSAEGVADLTRKLDEILTARREKYNKEQKGGGNKDRNTKKKTPLSKDD